MTVVARPIPADFAQHATEMRPVLAKRYGVSEALITRWRKRLGIPMIRGKVPSKPPAGFAEVATDPLTQLKQRYGVCGETIRRWRTQCGIVQLKPSIWKYRPEDFDQLAPTMTNPALAAHYGCGLKTIRRWRNEIGIASPGQKPGVKMHYRKSPKPRQFVQPVKGRMVLAGAKGYLPPPLGGREEAAAQFLRRHYPIVCRCDAQGHADQKGSHWLCGALVLEAAELIGRAERKGFDPDAWQRIAA